ncbi:MAG TPA: malate/lactate/ureidoglycolate dehydrogenase [Acetobacteraceae bacterium]|nr:malate/lactate/ureidoglycolate dehydrogenase [Acetobacteraceae bacterium]
MRVPAPVLHDFAAALFRAGGSDAEEADAVAAHLVEANLAGHDSHGVIRVPKYLDWVDAGLLLPNQHVTLARDLGALVVADGGFGYGQVIGHEAMELMASRARQHGICALALRNSGHLGRIGAWAEQLAAAGLVSIHFVNTSGFGILVAPFGATDRRLSANPIAAGAPGPDGPIILDIATSAIAEGKIQVLRNKGEALPPGLVLDGAGQPTRDPEAFYADPAGAILPFGGHKGSGLSIFCEILAGALTGGGSSHPEHPTAPRLVNNMLSLAFDPAATTDGFAPDVARLADWVRSARRADPATPVLLPGELERHTRAEREHDGIPVDTATWSALRAAAERRGVPAPAETVDAR